jgi:ankyrin repeat protein
LILHAAIEECRSDIVMLLLESGKADPNVVKGSDSALSMAVRKDDVRCVELLLGKKASINNKFVYVNMLNQHAEGNRIRDTFYWDQRLYLTET